MCTAYFWIEIFGSKGLDGGNSSRTYRFRAHPFQRLRPDVKAVEMQVCGIPLTIIVHVMGLRVIGIGREVVDECDVQCVTRLEPQCRAHEAIVVCSKPHLVFADCEHAVIHVQGQIQSTVRGRMG